MPYMHPNITQKCRYWAAATLMFNHNNLPLLPSFPNTIIADLQHQELLSQIALFKREKYGNRLPDARLPRKKKLLDTRYKL